MAAAGLSDHVLHARPQKVFVKFTTFYKTGKDLATFDSNCLTDIPLLVKASKLARFFFLPRISNTHSCWLLVISIELKISMAGTLQQLKKHFGWNKVIGCSVTKANGAMSFFTLRTCSHHGLFRR